MNEECGMEAEARQERVMSPWLFNDFKDSREGASLGNRDDWKMDILLLN